MCHMHCFESMQLCCHAVADPKGNSVLIDLVEHCHVWWIPSLRGVQKVRAGE